MINLQVLTTEEIIFTILFTVFVFQGVKLVIKDFKRK